MSGYPPIHTPTLRSGGEDVAWLGRAKFWDTLCVLWVYCPTPLSMDRPLQRWLKFSRLHRL